MSLGSGIQTGAGREWRKNKDPGKMTEMCAEKLESGELYSLWWSHPQSLVELHPPRTPVCLLQTPEGEGLASLLGKGFQAVTIWEEEVHC